MPIGGLIKGAPGPCVGIVGYDIFRSAVLKLPHSPRDGASRGAVRLELADPEGFQDDAPMALHWQVGTLAQYQDISNNIRSYQNPCR